MFNRSQGVDTTAPIPPIRNPIDLQEALEEDRTALLALGELIKTARLTDFDRDHFLKGTIAYTIADDAQYGLSKLINLCIDSQKRIVDSYVSRYMNGDEQLLKDAESIFESVKQGAFEPNRTRKELNRAVDFAERVASHGGGLADKAEALMASIFNHDLFRLCQTSKGDLMQSAPLTHHEVDEVAA